MPLIHALLIKNEVLTMTVCHLIMLSIINIEACVKVCHS